VGARISPRGRRGAGRRVVFDLAVRVAEGTFTLVDAEQRAEALRCFLLTDGGPVAGTSSRAIASSLCRRW